MKRAFFIPLLTIQLLLSCDELVAEGCRTDDHISQVKTVLNYPIVDTAQIKYFDNFADLPKKKLNDVLREQDASHEGATPSYKNHRNGTVTDSVTGLMWEKKPHRFTYRKAVNMQRKINTGGYSDWRLPTVKELYSLIVFSGRDPHLNHNNKHVRLKPFIESDVFSFQYGDLKKGERLIDAQYATCTLDVSRNPFGGGNMMYGVNFADGRIKGYPTGKRPGRSFEKEFFVIYVRGHKTYGENQYVLNEDDTVTDQATGLMWTKFDSERGMNWYEALEYAKQNRTGGYSDWRLPNVKELQSIVDYTKSPDATNSAAIDSVFKCSVIENEAGELDYGYYWTSTTHESSGLQNGSRACYIAFGRGLGFFHGRWIDVHGAGCQRSDPKSGSQDDHPRGHGPQGDAVRVLNFVRLVRDA